MKSYKISIPIILGILSFASSSLFASGSPIGVWKTIDDETKKAKSHVKIYEKNGKIYGRIIKLLNPSEPNPLCKKCSGRFSNKPILGLEFLWGFKKDGEKYTGGRILDPNNGKIYKCYIEVLGNGNKLKVRGYVGISLFGRTQYWYKVN